MIRITIDKSRVSSSDMILLKEFESDLVSHIKSLVNTEPYNDISVGFRIDIIERTSDTIKLVHNASFSLKNSFQLLNEVTNYLETRDDIEVCLKSYSLLISLEFKSKEKKETKTENVQDSLGNQAKKNSQESKEDNTPEFFPSEPRYNFRQIILSPEIKEEIFDAMKVIKCKDLIYNKWGFSEIDSIPRSVLNFYGEPGTGKTMCAHAIATELGKKILALNYAEIESKYVGEAPKNLIKAFQTAKEKDAVLFFDEADSFLGKRIQNVNHGSDQALNSLRSQMLILLEEYEGVVLFATNLVTNFDKAFESRILKHIRFDLPNKEARAAIIKKMLPAKLPIFTPFTDEQILCASEMIDGLSGREIKGAVMDMLLTKANESNPNVFFVIDDLYNALKKKKKAKDDLKAEENRLLKERISKKLSEKAEEAKAEKEMQDKAKEELSSC